MTGKRAAAAAIVSAAIVAVGVGEGTFGQTRARRSIDGPVTRESVVRSLSVVPAEDEVATSGGTEPGAAVDPSAPAELSVMLRVNFALESANLTPGALRDLDQVAAALLDPRLADVPVTLEGHTDATGADDYNLGLSRRRAAAVLAHLVSRGVSEGRVRAVGHGEHRLLSGYSPTDDLQRRVEIVRTF